MFKSISNLPNKHLEKKPNKKNIEKQLVGVKHIRNQYKGQKSLCDTDSLLSLMDGPAGDYTPVTGDKKTSKNHYIWLLEILPSYFFPFNHIFYCISGATKKTRKKLIWLLHLSNKTTYEIIGKTKDLCHHGMHDLKNKKIKRNVPLFLQLFHRFFVPPKNIFLKHSPSSLIMHTASHYHHNSKGDRKWDQNRIQYRNKNNADTVHCLSDHFNETISISDKKGFYFLLQQIKMFYICNKNSKSNNYNMVVVFCFDFISFTNVLPERGSCFFIFIIFFANDPLFSLLVYDIFLFRFIQSFKDYFIKLCLFNYKLTGNLLGYQVTHENVKCRLPNFQHYI